MPDLITQFTHSIKIYRDPIEAVNALQRNDYSHNRGPKRRRGEFEVTALDWKRKEVTIQCWSEDKHLVQFMLPIYLAGATTLPKTE